MNTLPQLQSLIRLCCLLFFIGGGLFPVYVPRTASGSDAAAYLTNEQFLLVEEGFVMKTASISEAGYRLAYSKGIAHHVGSGESLVQIADLYDISLETIRWANELTEGEIIHPQQSLLILPVDGVLHTVRRGQSLLKIAALYDVPVEDIANQNHIQDGKIFAGQQVIIPRGKPLVETGKPSPTATARRGRPPGRAGRTGIVTPEPPRPTPPPEALPPPSYGIFQKPCDCTYTQYYRPGHYAVDLARNGGGPIFAAENGIVIRADYGWNGGFGNIVEIDHGHGLVSLYAHNRALHVREGAAVRRGDVIATMGNTGRVYGQTGVHVHFETILNGVKKNPLLYLQ